MKQIRITPQELAQLKALQIKHRLDWPAVFSANECGQIWPFVTRGFTRHQSREELRGISRILDNVADKYETARAGMGRFFIDETGAYYKDKSGELTMFVEFRLEPRRFPRL